ncbi:unnamed protein product [Lactuca saligna]|uniref:Uncharacterized protein n=1 Tax=Lactuca saligna TaxID=75948 RepID=A0AA35W0B7_LACSI|nr:unnamed protein product [Lactuca saligna]
MSRSVLFPTSETFPIKVFKKKEVHLTIANRAFQVTKIDHDEKTFQVEKAKVHDLFVSRHVDLALLEEEVLESKLLLEDMIARKEFMGLDHMVGPFFLKTLLKYASH